MNPELELELVELLELVFLSVELDELLELEECESILEELELLFINVELELLELELGKIVYKIVPKF